MEPIKRIFPHYKDKFTPVVTYLILTSLFILGLNLPAFSIASIIIILPIILFIIPKNKIHLNKTELLINFLLIGFTTSFYITSWMYNYIELTRGLRYILAIQSSYLLGHYSFYIFNQKNTGIYIIKPIIFLTLGFSVFAITATLLKSIEVNSFFVDIENIRKIHIPGTKIVFYSTILAAFCSLGISLLPVAIKLSFFSNKNKNVFFLATTIYLMTIGGIITSLMFSNRSSFCMIVYLGIILLFYYSYLKYKTTTFPWIKLALIIFLVLSSSYILFSKDLSSLKKHEIPILKRFGDNNLGISRFKLWRLGLRHLTSDFKGGKPYPLTPTTPQQHTGIINFLSKDNNLLRPDYYQFIYKQKFSFPFLHNLWLDIHYQAGIIPFCFLIFVHD